MAELFENFVDDIGLIPKLKIAREKYLAELREEYIAELREECIAELREECIAECRAEARAKVFAEERAEGESRFAKLTQCLLESGRTNDLSRVVTDIDYRKDLYALYNL
ncbi:MAG: hypothetical protein K2O59_16150 [Lachnospiraceae bacterium]|nr:hypothetical protein [Lachnospiraceae bacterium]